MPSKLYSGSQILKFEKMQKGRKKPKGWSLTSITPKQFARNIRKKYGRVEKSAKYYHRGNGEVAKHSVSRDRKRRSRKSSKYRPPKSHFGDY